MINVKFTRDEVILALDVLFFSGEKHLNQDSPAIKDLCSILQSLPIYSEASRPAIFRNESGVSKQLYSFQLSQKANRKNPNVGAEFYSVYSEFGEYLPEIHEIANAIRKNLSFICSSFSSFTLENHFREGILLNFLHRAIEQKGGRKVPCTRCEICHIDLDGVYRTEGKLIQQHLLVPLADLDARAKYSANRYISVCPNCHAAIHQHRPWCSRANVTDILL